MKKKPLMGKDPPVGVFDRSAHRRRPAVGARAKEILGMAGSAVRRRSRAGEGSNRPQRER